MVVLPWSRFDSDWFPWSSNGKSKIQPVTKCQCPVTGAGTTLHLLNWPVHHHACAVDSNILIIASVDTNLCQLLRQLKENDEQPFEKCQQLRTAMCCYSPLICPFHPSKVHMAKNGWRYSYTLHWNIIVPIISVNPVSNRQLVQRRYQVGKAPCSRQLRRRKIWGFYKIGWSNGACNLWSTFK